MDFLQCVLRKIGVPILCCMTLATDVSADICDRTPEVRDKILEQFPHSDCGDISDEDLASILTLDLSSSGIRALKAGDFAGLSSLRRLRFPGNELKSLPDGLFEGLASVRQLWIHGNELASLPAGTFTGLTNLVMLLMGSNRLTELEEGLFDGLPLLEQLFSAATKSRSCVPTPSRAREPAMALLPWQSVDGSARRNFQRPVGSSGLVLLCKA